MDKVTLELIASPGELPPFRTQLQTWLGQTGISQKKSGEILVAVQEALTNIVRHAYGGKEGKIEVCYQDCGDQIEIVLRDHGNPFDPSKIPAPELPPVKPGGLGLYLMKTLMDQVEYQKNHEGNVLRLIKFKKSKR